MILERSGKAAKSARRSFAVFSWVFSKLSCPLSLLSIKNSKGDTDIKRTDFWAQWGMERVG